MIEPFRIDVPDPELAELRARIRSTRWPGEAPGEAWEQGTDRAFLQELLASWADEFDWRATEREFNAYPQFVATLDGVRIHFVHVRATRGNGVPLVLTHGWPGAFVELLPLVPRLSETFDLVIPSLPGYAFSERPHRTGVNYRYVAGLWHRLMAELGYERYGAHGTDFGAGVSTLMALDQPERMLGLHLSNLELTPRLGGKELTPAEQAYVEASDRWWEKEGGYKAIQSTKPQTLGYGLTDSPAGLAAWILEKYHSWTDSGGNPERVSRDYLLTLLSLYWFTGSITSSMRDYFDNRWTGVTIGPDDYVRTPTAIAGFVHQYANEGDPPREWAERLYNVTRWTPMPRGGHFAAVEEPDLLADDLAAFFAGLE